MEGDLGESEIAVLAFMYTTARGSLLVSRYSRICSAAQQIERPAATLARYALFRNHHVDQILGASRLRNGLGNIGVFDARSGELRDLPREPAVDGSKSGSFTAEHALRLLQRGLRVGAAADVALNTLGFALSDDAVMLVDQ